MRQKISDTRRHTASDIESLMELTRPIALDIAIGRLFRLEAIGAMNVNEVALAAARRNSGGRPYALAHLEKQDFGLCRDWGESIALRRITAESAPCVKCAE